MKTMYVIELEQGSLIHTSDNSTDTATTVTTVISTIGVSLSAAAILLLLLTAYLFPEWRKNFKNQYLIQFMIARFQYTFVRYFFDLRHVYSLCDKFECIIYLDEYTMIFTEAALVSWMFVFSRQMYASLVKVFTDKPNVVRVSVATWVFSGVISVLFYTIFRLQDDSDIRYFFIYLGLFKWPVLIANACILISIFKSITKAHQLEHRAYFRMVVVMVTLIFTFCFHQIIIDLYKVLHLLFNLPSYILIISNTMMTYHCAFSIIFWVFGNAKTRAMWKNCCHFCNGLTPLLMYQISTVSVK